MFQIIIIGLSSLLIFSSCFNKNNRVFDLLLAEKLIKENKKEKKEEEEEEEKLKTFTLNLSENQKRWPVYYKIFESTNPTAEELMKRDIKLKLDSRGKITFKKSGKNKVVRFFFLPNNPQAILGDMLLKDYSFSYTLERIIKLKLESLKTLLKENGKEDIAGKIKPVDDVIYNISMFLLSSSSNTTRTNEKLTTSSETVEKLRKNTEEFPSGDDNLTTRLLTAGMTLTPTDFRIVLETVKDDYEITNVISDEDLNKYLKLTQ